MAFVGSTAYVLVTLVGPDVGGSDIVGIYRVDSPDSFTVIADIGAFSLQSPPRHGVLRPHGGPVRARDLPWRLVTDGHLNRVLRVTLDGDVTELEELANISPGWKPWATGSSWPD